MGVKISDLPSNSTPALTDVFPENHGGATYKATLSDVKNLFDIPVVDSTLTISGAAADAAVTGESLKSGQGTRNFFADPNATLLQRGAHITANINFGIFSSIDMTQDAFVYRDGNIVKNGVTSGNKTYGCTVVYDPVLFGDKVCLSCIQNNSTRLSLYIRFLDSSGTQISQKYINSDAVGNPHVSAEVPTGTDKIKVWFQSNVTAEWSISKPALTNGSLPITGGSDYWDSVMAKANVLDGYFNYFIDPEFTIFKTSPKYGNPAIVYNSFIYRSLFSSPTIVYDSGKLKQPAGATGAVNYGTEVENVESFFGGHASFAVNIVEYNDPSVLLYAYLRFYDENGTQLANAYARTYYSGLLWVDADIPNGTKTIKAWVQSSSATAWSFDSPVLTSRLAMMMPCSDMLWKTINAEMTNIAYVATEADLTNALNLKNDDKVIYILNDMTITSDVLINKDVTIDGLGHTLTGSGLTSYLIGITNAKVCLKNLTLIGEQTTDYVVLPYTGADVTIENCNINTSYDTIVRCNNNAVVTIRDCDISYSYNNDGIAPADTAVVKVFNTKVHDCADEGLSSHNSSYTEVHGCEFYRNGYLPGTDTPSSVGSFGGCHIGGGKMGIVEGCYSHDNRTYGIALINFQQDLPDDIEKCFNNLVQGNGSVGIYCTYCKHLTLVNNACIANVGDAIHFGDAGQSDPIGVASSGYVAGNTIFENGTDSIIVDSGASSPTLYIQS